MRRALSNAAAIAIAASLLLAGCSGGAGHFTPAVSDDGSQDATASTAPVPSDDAQSVDSNADSGTDATPAIDLLPGPPSKIALKPSVAALLSTGSISALAVGVSEKGYKGGFRQSSTCKKVATISPASLKKAGKFDLQGKAAGSCAVTIKDTQGNKAVLKVSDTVAAISLASSSISPGGKSVTVTLRSVNGKPPAKGLTTTIKTNLPPCASGCSISGPQAPPGTDVFSVSISDGSNGAGNVLATGTVTGAIKNAKKTSVTATLPKNVASVSIGTVPAGSAGTAFGAAAVALTVRDADGNAVTGAYAQSVTVASNDTTGATTLGGGTGSATSQSFSSSSQSPTLAYTGLAIGPVTITPSAAGATTGTKGTFAPVASSIVYAGPKVSSNPEIDLYSTSGTGSSGQFTLTQPGWFGGSFSRGFSYAVCSSGNPASYAISPASGSANAYTVTATNAAAAGTCTLTVNGGAGAALSVKLTYTTSSVGVDRKTH